MKIKKQQQHKTYFYLQNIDWFFLVFIIFVELFIEIIRLKWLNFEYVDTRYFHSNSIAFFHSLSLSYKTSRMRASFTFPSLANCIRIIIHMNYFCNRLFFFILYLYYSYWIFLVNGMWKILLRFLLIR